MIKVVNLNKKYNTHRRNEIHVLNNISLEFNSTGLVCILGPSGSGKTTLLNAIGGLDKVDSGEIYLAGEKITKYNFSKWDRLRRQNIGFIFQNYALLPDLTVYENVRFTLQMMDISEEEIQRRVEYALQAVNMEKFINRKARNLSGGQQQRVAIARALVTSPNVIIADEPTGNLDAANSMQIMNIIKRISKECLVILVTHNRSLASFYADQIIEIKDGKIINDYTNTSTGSFEIKHDQNIYLQELQVDTLQNEDVKISYFYEQEKKPVNLKLVYKNNTLYIACEGESIEIKFLTPSDEVKLIDGKRPEITHENLEEFDYHLEKINPRSKRTRSVIPLLSAIKTSYKRLTGMRRFQKFLLISSFMITAILIVVSVSTFIGFRRVDLIYQPYVHKNLIRVEYNINNKSLNEVQEFVDLLYEYKGSNESDIEFYISNIAPYDNVNYIYDLFLQVPDQFRRIPLRGSLIDSKFVSQNQLIDGRMPSKVNEIVIDKMVLDLVIKNDGYKIGILKYEQFLYGEFQYFTQTGTIVGIADTGNPAIFINFDFVLKATIGNILFDTDTNLYQTTYNKSLASNEVLVNANDYEINIPESIHIGNSLFKVVGTFTTAIENVNYVINKEASEKVYLLEGIINGGKSIIDLYSKDVTSTISFLNNNPQLEPYKVKAENTYKKILDEYRRDHALQLSAQTVFSIIFLTASLLFLYFAIRSSMMSRIYEIGVYRALGVSRFDIYKIFGTEITLMTLSSTVIGWGIISYIFLRTDPNLLPERIYYNGPLAIVILIGIWIINLTAGLLPVYGLLRKTPAEILTKYDI
ncbi:MAG: ABC transporter ATP-binding protein/permease [Acholeplasmataceae bacterium]|nr:ABC transporter ATP-binding protein/permease [Acholeplasmataceae bacterium]